MKIDKIKNYQETNNSFAFYKRTIDFIDKCISFLDDDLLTDEQCIRKHAKGIWHEKYDPDQLRNLRKKLMYKISTLEPDCKQSKVLKAILFYLHPYEDWPDNARANILEHFVSEVENAGVAREDLNEIFTQNFADILN